MMTRGSFFWWATIWVSEEKTFVSCSVCIVLRLIPFAPFDFTQGLRQDIRLSDTQSKNAQRVVVDHERIEDEVRTDSNGGSKWIRTTDLIDVNDAL